MRNEALPVVLFDGLCNLCNASVRWLLEHDPEGRYRMAPLQSTAAREILAERLSDEEIDALPDAIVLVDADGVHTESTAALRIAAGLGWPWKAMGGLLFIPRVIRDGIYRWIAANRYRWFGRCDACMVPEPGVDEIHRRPTIPRDPATP